MHSMGSDAGLEASKPCGYNKGSCISLVQPLSHLNHRVVVQSTQLEARHDAIVPGRVGIPEDVQRSLACVVLPEVAIRGVRGDELLAKLSHGEGPAVFEASNEAAIQTEEQVLAVAVEVVFGELIHHV
jgi:hypothetical protein